MWQPVLMINGFITFILGIMMFIPALTQYIYTGKFDFLFVQSALILMFLGGLLFLANYGKIKKISILQGFLITVFCWFSAALVSAVPLWGNGDIKSVYDAIFEATSGITSTGATILTDIEAQSKSVLIWRAMLNSLGGIGIVIFAVVMMPFLGIGGMHIFKKENSDTEEKFLPKVRYIAKDIICVYILLNICCAILLKISGMEWFDAIAHALATVCTGGFSTKNASIAAFNSTNIEIIIAIFMILGALPLTYFVLMAKKHNISSIVSNPQVNTLLKLIFLYVLLLSVFYAYNNDIAFIKAFREVSFSVISIITTTGFTSSDFLLWGNWAVIVILILSLHGGCTGSTSGSVKIFRWQVIGSFFRKYAIKSLSPNQVAVIKTGDKVVDDNIVSSVFVLVLSFLGAIVFFTLVLSLSGLDFLTALGAVCGMITSFGPGLTIATGPSGNYADMSDFVKIILSFVMVLGRLEVVTVVILLSKLKKKLQYF